LKIDLKKDSLNFLEKIQKNAIAINVAHHIEKIKSKIKFKYWKIICKTKH
jgi:hypothetical protein